MLASIQKVMTTVQPVMKQHNRTHSSLQATDGLAHQLAAYIANSL